MSHVKNLRRKPLTASTVRLLSAGLRVVQKLLDEVRPSIFVAIADVVAEANLGVQLGMEILWLSL